MSRVLVVAAAAVAVFAAHMCAAHPLSSAGWRMLPDAPVPADTAVHFTLHLQPENEEQFDSRVADIADPESERYRDFLTQEQVASLLRPSSETLRFVDQWLKNTAHTFGPLGITVEVSTPVSQAERLLGGKFHVYEHTDTGVRRIANRHRDMFERIPRKHIRVITGVAELLAPRIDSKTSDTDDSSSSSGSNDDGNDLLLAARQSANTEPKKNIIPQINPVKWEADVALGYVLTPESVKYMYNVPAGASMQGSIGVVTFGGTYDAKAFSEFAAELLPGSNVAVSRTVRKPEGLQVSQNANVAVQWAAALTGSPSVWHYGYGDNIDSFWLMTWAKDILADLNDAKLKATAPSVFVFTNSLPSELHCNTNEGDCRMRETEIRSYIDATETQFKAIGALGVTLVVSSGFDGAPGGGTSRCPSRFDGTCHAFRLVRKSPVAICTLPNKDMDSVCKTLLALDDCKVALEKFRDGGQGQACNLVIDQNSFAMNASCPCKDLSGTEYNSCIAESDYPSASTWFSPGYPASSPSVISVGTTRLTRWSNEACAERILPGKQVCEMGERVASTETGANVTSGGGFSRIHKCPEWQCPFLARYKSVAGDNHAPQSGSWDPSYRGFPDLAALGTNCVVREDGLFRPAMDTSCSAVVFASMVALLSEKQKMATKKGLGPLGKTLYTVSEQELTAFIDITVGNNTCSRQDCCRFGYEAVKGWDPVSGLGSPNYVSLHRGIFPADYKLPEFARTPGTRAPVRYASRSQLPLILVPFTVLGWLVSAGIIFYFSRNMQY